MISSILQLRLNRIHVSGSDENQALFTPNPNPNPNPRK